MSQEDWPFSAQLSSRQTRPQTCHFLRNRPASWTDLQFDCHHGNLGFWYMKVGEDFPLEKSFQLPPRTHVAGKLLAWDGPGLGWNLAGPLPSQHNLALYGATS